MGRIKFIVFVTVLAMLAGCGSSSSPGAKSTLAPITVSSPNVQHVIVGAGPTNDYSNGIFTSVTVCIPGSATSCQTIDGLLVDTGSSGLRILSSAVNGELTLNLPQSNNPDGNSVAECSQYVDLTYTWGAVRIADVKIAGETASSVPINILGDADFPTVPGSCSNTGGVNNNSPQTLGANGILGVGVFQQDCGDACASGVGPPPPASYYECPSPASCQPAFVSVSQQVRNPVVSFATDNNGVILELPAVPAASVSASGSLVFGIGTQPNNGLGSAMIFPVNAFGNFSYPVVYNNRSFSGGFIDSGSNAIYFSDYAGIPVCTDYPGFYCPPSTQALSAVNQGANNAISTVTFNVGNADQLFVNPNDAVFGTLAGTNPDTQGFDWGLPFFFGRDVYVGIQDKSSPGGLGPYWAY